MFIVKQKAKRKIEYLLQGFNKSMLIVLIFLSITAYPFVFTYGQTLFNIIPEIGVDKNQGVCRAVICSDSSFYVVGHRFDTMGFGSNAKPWHGKFDYSGILNNHEGLKDTLSINPLNTNSVLYALKDQKHAYLYVRKVLSPPSYTPVLIEIDLSNGDIVRSKLLPNSQYPGVINGQGGIVVDHDTIYLVSHLYFDDSIKTFITIVDSNFNEISLIEVHTPEKEMVPHFLSKNKNNTYTIIGDMRIEVNGNQKICNYFLTVDVAGTLISYNTPDVGNIYSFQFADNRSVIDNKDNWVLFVHKVVNGPDSCTPCWANIPYMYSISKNSDSVLWETKLYNIPLRQNPAFYVKALTQLIDGFIGAGEYIKADVDLLPSSGVLFKTSLNGDSLWMKHYIPLNWDNDRVFWATFKDVSQTPFGTIIAVGEVSDREEGVIKPWILHVDGNGCLVPGCEIVGIEDILPNRETINHFKVYPNPASVELYFLALQDNASPFRLQLISSTGSLLQEVEFHVSKGNQYILPIDDLPPGPYQLIFTGTPNSMPEVHTFIKI